MYANNIPSTTTTATTATTITARHQILIFGLNEKINHMWRTVVVVVVVLLQKLGCQSTKGFGIASTSHTQNYNVHDNVSSNRQAERSAVECGCNFVNDRKERTRKSD